MKRVIQRNLRNSDSNLLSNIKNRLIQIQKKKFRTKWRIGRTNWKYKSTNILLQERIDLQERLINNQQYRIEILLSRIDYLEQNSLIKRKIVVLPIMIMTIINKTRKIDAIVAPAVLQVRWTHASTSPLRHRPAHSTQIITGFGTLNKSIGPRLQR
jgi:hypothetical protein